MAAPGSRSEGLRIRVFPVATAIGIVQSGIIAGKLNGAMLVTKSQKSGRNDWGKQR